MMNDPGSRHSDPFEDALSDGAQHAAQLASIAAMTAQLLMQRRAMREARKAAAGDRETAERLDQHERNLHRQQRLAWASAHDRRWLAEADIFATAQAWSAAVLHADTDPEAAAAVRKCEDRLRHLHPYAMTRYDRLRADGMDPADAMREAAPFFAREPYVRTGEAAPGRPALTTLDGSMRDQDGSASPQPRPSATDPAMPGEKRGEQIAARIQAQAREAGRDELGAAELATVLETLTNLPPDAIERITARVTHRAGRSAGQPATPNAAQRAAVSFPHAITDVVAASSTASPARRASSTDRTQTRRRGLSP